MAFDWLSNFLSADHMSGGLSINLTKELLDLICKLVSSSCFAFLCFLSSYLACMLYIKIAFRNSDSIRHMNMKLFVCIDFMVK